MTLILTMQNQNTIIIENIEEYRQEIQNGNLILDRKYPYLDEKEVFGKDLRGSNPYDCELNGKKLNKCTKYKKLLHEVYKSTSKEIILQNATLNVSEEEIYEKGFTHVTKLGLSIQGADARRTLKEICNIVKITGCNLKMKIRLNNGDIVCFMLYTGEP